LNRLSFILILFVLFSCEQPTEPLIEEVVEEVVEEPTEEPEETPQEEPENFIPFIELIPGSSMVSNGASVTFTVTIDDQDDFYHFYCWTVDGESCGDTESLTFSKSPDVEQSYIITVAVSDGKDLVSASSVITVQDKPWSPEPLHIYLFPVGTAPGENLWVKMYICSDVADYDYKSIAVRTSLELYNRDNEPDAYILMGGYE
jgi:hypothetical protein